MASKTVTFAVGQPVPWPKAPGGIAQVEDVMRRRVRLAYRARTGRWRFPVVRAAVLARLIEEQQAPLLPLRNPAFRM